MIRKKRTVYKIVFLLTVVVLMYSLMDQKSTFANTGVEQINVKYNEPVNTNIPRIVVYLWCGLNPQFTFTNYLSVLSANKYLKPERILFLYSVYPEKDKYNYNSWLEELSATLPNFETQNLSWPAVQGSCRTQKSQKEFLAAYLNEGGIFIGTSSILTAPVLFLWDEYFIDGMIEPRLGIVVRAPGSGRNKNQTKSTSKEISCFDINDLLWNQTDLPRCINLHAKVLPKDLISLKGKLTESLSYIMYDKSTPSNAQPNLHPVIPNIAHILWLNSKPVDFLFYLSALSLLYVVKVDRLYIHGNYEPARSGYWGKLLREEGQRVKYILRQKPRIIYGQETNSPHLMSDIFRAFIMIEYGGIYSDVDVIWTQEIPMSLRYYNAVASFDWAHAMPYYPDYINLGVSMGAKGSKFWKFFLESFKDLRSDVFGYNGLLQPYKIYERHPESILINNHLQVMCFYDKCHPLWTKENWKNIDWKKETHAFHWTYPNPSEFSDEQTLLNSTSIWADIGKFVLRKAHRLDPT